MSFFQQINQKLGETVSPLEKPATYVVAFSKLNTSTYNFNVLPSKISISNNLVSPIKYAKVIKLTKWAILSHQFKLNLPFLFSDVEIEFNFEKLKRAETTNFDFVFNTFSSTNLFENPDIPIISENSFEDIEKVKISDDLCKEFFLTYEENTEVSNNLFQPLFSQKVNGKSYENRKERQAEQADLFSDRTKSKPDGFIKAYKREKTKGTSSNYSTQSLTFWDLLFPVLLPPLDANFDSQIEFYKPLFNFQPAGIEFLVTNQSALLADEMGTGKTVMSAVALKLLFRLGRAKKALIICPVSLLKTWQDHLQNWANELELTVVRGTSEVRKLDWKYKAHIYLSTYDTVASDFLTKIKKHNKFVCPKCKSSLNLGNKITLEDENMPTFFCPFCEYVLNDYLIANLPKKNSIVDPEIINSFDVVLIDEAQYVKNKTSDRSRAIRLLKTNYRWALTGTPIENRLEDIVSIFSFVNPALFKNEYISPGSVAEAIKPYFLRRLKKDVMKDLPPKVKQEIWLELDNDQMRAYKSVEQLEIKKLEELGGKVTKIHIFSLISKLKQICNFAPNKEKSAKTEELLDLVEQIKESGQKMLIFSQYDVEGVAKLKKLLQPFGVSVLKGGMSDAARNAAIEKFKNDPDISVFLATIKVGGVGLTLTEASYVIHFDHWWNPALMWQADDRVHRSGQKSSQVNIYSFWMQGTIEERIHHILKEKGLLFDEVINGLSSEAIDEKISIEDWLEILGIKTNKRTNKSYAGSDSDQQYKKQNQQKEEKKTNSNNYQRNENNHQQSKTEIPISNESVRIAHAILEIRIGATKKQITSAYRNMMKVCHPDKAMLSSAKAFTLAEERTKQINSAYETLKKHKYV